MEYDPDDTQPPITLVDIYWHYMNRWAEWGMGIARSYGWKETKMFQRCEAPGCMKFATRRCKFLDPRRSHDVVAEYTVKHFCCDECQLAIVDELERIANIVRCVQ